MKWAFVILTSLFFASCGEMKEKAAPEVAEAKAPAAAQVPVPEVIPAQKFAGRWQRTDGGYVIDVKSVTADGKLDIAYYNPNPINVGSSAWQNDGGRLMMVVELRDVNYPGSIYSLEYKPQGDMLSGSYYQAVEQQTYQVEFSRIK